MTAHPLRARLFVALTGAALMGAFTTGVYAVLVDPLAIGFAARAASVLPKALLLAAGLLPVLFLGAVALGRALARPVEDVADAAERVAQGDSLRTVVRGEDSEARRIALALASLRREIDRTPCTRAVLRDGWHDLKNPLTAVRASLSLLEEGGLARVDVARFTSHAARSAAELEARLETLVTWSRLETSALAPRSHESLRDVVRDAIERARPLAEARGVELAVELGAARGPASIRCDPEALARAFTNLIENACAASPGGSIRVACLDRAEDGVVVEVVNEPARVPRAVRPNLFQRGAGLGLAIARAAVEAHGGRVRFVEWGPPRVRVRVELPR